ncbi:uncharacterized protein BT62DRAFT_927552 [Guyanagaster necrorhizus]|uniref:Uncharacterized protein n=1 Tax=Guyanagaster necrorhizus TaxID=856835 RepID=A0A9P7W0P2_9AGAR|nr:uncharacterized protein BT62DRAFT_927552 [Guyanagaster necrorhizus MCA 3950]KAG7450235.1 hypothetical protein BT62DRAFT_927552 [Guyanagaster necrorhizus MCA 3950]
MASQLDLFTAAHDSLSQPPPPTVREILDAYRAKGDGDRDMLLAMLKAKTAEEHSQAERAALLRTLIDVQRHTSSYLPSPHISHYPTPSTSHSPPQQHHLLVPHRQSRHQRSDSPYALPPMADTRARKRHRGKSQSPPRHPPSPYSPTSSSSSAADYSPRAIRPSMAIGALLSNGRVPELERDTITQLSDISDERSKARDYPMTMS